MLSSLSASHFMVRFGKAGGRLQLDLGALNAKAKSVALKELDESEQIKVQAMQELKRLLSAEDTLKCPTDNEDWLLKFLRPCKFHADSAKDLIKRYYSFKQKNWNVYANLLPNREANVFGHDIVTVLPRRDQHGRRIIIFRLGKYWDQKSVKIDEIFKASVLVMEALLWEPLTQVQGTVAIFDMSGLTISQTFQVTPAAAKRMVDCFQDSMPVRIKGLHVVNQTRIFNALYRVFKPLLRRKLAERIHFHGEKGGSLLKHISPECLPAAFGGTLSTEWIDSSKWYQLLLKYEREFETINSYGYV